MLNKKKIEKNWFLFAISYNFAVYSHNLCFI